MVKNSVFRDMEMMMLPVTDSAQIFADRFMLTDNLDISNGTEELEQLRKSEYPFKLNFNMVLFCIGGSIKVRVNFREYTLSSCDVLITLPGTIGECLEHSADCRMFVIAFSGNMDIPAMNTTEGMRIKRYVSSNAVVRITSKEMEECRVIYSLMRDKITDPDFVFKQEILGGYMQVIFAVGFQWLMDNESQSDFLKKLTRRQTLCSDFLELVRTDHLKQREIGYYAEKLCVTPKYLSWAVKQVSGRLAGEWIRDYVILEAKALLKSNLYTVLQISEMLNFTSPSFFGKYFKAAVGCTPRQYATDT